MRCKYRFRLESVQCKINENKRLTGAMIRYIKESEANVHDRSKLHNNNETSSNRLIKIAGVNSDESGQNLLNGLDNICKTESL